MLQKFALGATQSDSPESFFIRADAEESCWLSLAMDCRYTTAHIVIISTSNSSGYFCFLFIEIQCKMCAICHETSTVIIRTIAATARTAPVLMYVMAQSLCPTPVSHGLEDLYFEKFG